MNELVGKTALVTGASRGIGKAIALELARRGATVIGTATSDHGAEQIQGYLSLEKDLQAGYAGLCLDVSDPESIESLLSEIKTRFSMPDILVNNAAITRDNLLMRMSIDEWQSIIDTNLTSVYRMSKACLRAMSKSKWGRIVNISSVVACSGNPGQTNYSASKAGLQGFTKSLAREVGSRGITVNAVAPGFIDTDMTRGLPDAQKQELTRQIPLNRLGEAKEVASCVAFLTFPCAGYVTGETLHVNGGMYMG